MAEDLRVKLEGEIQETEWEALKPHHLRGALLWVAPELEMPDVGARMAANDATAIEQWLALGKLQKPNPLMTEPWETLPGKRFLFLIVQPFVLFQESRLH